MKWILFFFLVISNSLFGQNGFADVQNSGWSGDLFSKEKTLPTISYTPFELEGGMIFVEAELNGKRANFILDTGAPGLVLNSLQIPANHALVSGVLGEKAIGKVQIEQFSWAGWNHLDVSALLMDMSSFEKLTGRKIQGLIGYDLIKEKELFIDFDNQMIRLSNTRNPVSGRQEPKEIVGFSLLEHLPIVKVKINGKTGYFGLDTGSEINMIHPRWKNKLNISSTQKANLLELDGDRSQVETIQLDRVSVGNVQLESMSFYLVDLSNIETEHGIRLDGILGFPFFHSKEISLNFGKQKLCIWE